MPQSRHHDTTTQHVPYTTTLKRPTAKSPRSLPKPLPRPVSRSTRPRKTRKQHEDEDKHESSSDSAMTTSFLQYCAMCEKQIRVPDSSILYCSEACRRMDGLGAGSYPPTSLPLTPSAKTLPPSFSFTRLASPFVRQDDDDPDTDNESSASASSASSSSDLLSLPRAQTHDKKATEKAKKEKIEGSRGKASPAAPQLTPALSSSSSLSSLPSSDDDDDDDGHEAKGENGVVKMLTEQLRI